DDVATGLRWHRVDVRPAEMGRLPLFRRMLGRLTPDLVQLVPPAPTDDTAAQAALERALQEDPLTAHSDLMVRVAHGVAVLDGWLRTMAGKLVAERLAR